MKSDNEYNNNTSNRIVGIEIGLLEEIIRTVVRQEMACLRTELQQVEVSKNVTPAKKERLYTQDVMEILDVTRHTVRNYVQQRELPQPHRDISNRPYWTSEQLENIIRLKGAEARFPI